MPPEADPVMPASKFTAIDTETSGLSGAIVSTASRSTAKPVSEAMTAPKPTCEAVLSSGMTELPAPCSRLWVMRGSRSLCNHINRAMAAASATVTAQRPRTLPMWVSPNFASAK